MSEQWTTAEKYLILNFLNYGKNSTAENTTFVIVPLACCTLNVFKAMKVWDRTKLRFVLSGFCSNYAKLEDFADPVISWIWTRPPTASSSTTFCRKNNRRYSAKDDPDNSVTFSSVAENDEDDDSLQEQRLLAPASDEAWLVPEILSTEGWTVEVFEEWYTTLLRKTYFVVRRLNVC